MLMAWGRFARAKWDELPQKEKDEYMVERTVAKKGGGKADSIVRPLVHWVARAIKKSMVYRTRTWEGILM